MADIYTMGVDVGSTTSKCLVLKNGTDVVGSAIIPAGTGTSGPSRAVAAALEQAGLQREHISALTATGYGRNTFEGADYVVSPFQLLINDGNYYLLAFDGKKIIPYRVDRMKDVQRTGEPREGQAEFDKIDIRTYTQRVFSMFSGKKKRRVTIQFLFTLLDTAVERFGTRDAQYSMVDDKHFTVNAEVEISDQFFGWLLGFGKRAKILYPDDVVEDFRAYLDKVREMY